MTKGEAYKKYGLDIGEVNFNLNEEADDKFIAGCKALCQKKRSIMGDQIKYALADLDKRFGVEAAKEIKIKLLLDLVKHLLDADGISVDFAAFVATILQLGCDPDMVFKAFDIVGDIALELQFESEDDNND